MDNLQALTPANLYGFIVVFVALMGLVVLAGATVDALKKFAKPRLDRRKITDVKQGDIMAKCEATENQLAEHNERIERLEESMRIQCAALYALLEHELHNGNADEMQAASRALFNHLNK